MLRYVMSCYDVYKVNVYVYCSPAEYAIRAVCNTSSFIVVSHLVWNHAMGAPVTFTGLLIMLALGYCHECARRWLQWQESDTYIQEAVSSDDNITLLFPGVQYILVVVLNIYLANGPAHSNVPNFAAKLDLNKYCYYTQPGRNSEADLFQIADNRPVALQHPNTVSCL